MIIHIDIDSFFASVEISLRPDIVNKEVVVAHPEGMVLAANYIAKNKGVKTTDLASHALRMLDNPLLFNVRYGSYQLASEYFFSCLHQIISKLESPRLLQISIDECFIETPGKITETDLLELKSEIFRKVNLPVSIGAGSSKLIAKQASKRAKPFGVYLVSDLREIEFLNSFTLNELWGFGPKTVEKMQSFGIDSVSDLLSSKQGKVLGIDIQALKGHLFDAKLEDESAGKSISVERSFRNGFTSPKLFLNAYSEILNSLSYRLKVSKLGFKNLEVRVQLSDYSSYSYKHKERQHTSNTNLLAFKINELRSNFDSLTPSQIRKITMVVSNLSQAENLELFTDYPIYEIEPPIFSLLDLIFYGMPVYHNRFGEGRVCEIAKDALIVEFTDRKRIISDYSSLLFSY